MAHKEEIFETLSLFTFESDLPENQVISVLKKIQDIAVETNDVFLYENGSVTEQGGLCLQNLIKVFQSQMDAKIFLVSKKLPFADAKSLMGGLKLASQPPSNNLKILFDLKDREISAYEELTEKIVEKRRLIDELISRELPADASEEEIQKEIEFLLGNNKLLHQGVAISKNACTHLEEALTTYLGEDKAPPRKEVLFALGEKIKSHLENGT